MDAVLKGMEITDRWARVAMDLVTVEKMPLYSWLS